MTNGKKANSNLKKYVKDFFKDLELYDDRVNGHHYEDLLQASVERFLEYENSYTAREVYENFFTIYQITGEDKSEELKVKSKKLSETNALLKLADMMKKYEDNTGELIEKQRDHFIHSVNVFVLGLAIYSQNTTYQQEFVDYILRSGYEKYYKMPGGYISHEEFLYRWGIASLFHDIGYPVEIIAKQLSKYINDGTHSISYKYDVQTALDFENFNQFNSIVKIDPHFTDVYRERYMEANYLNLYKSTNILAHQIFNDLYKEEDFRNYDEFERQSDDLYKLVNHLENFVEYMAKNNFVDHGYFSSIFVLNSYSALMQNYYYDRNCEIPEGEELNGTDEKTTDSREKYVYFFYPLLNSATAILLHNYYRGTLQNKDFGLGQLEVHQNPLAFLLILCDELQEWNRRPIGIKDKRKNHVNDIDIVVSNSEITVKYILKNAYLGLGFSDDKEKLINKLLDVEGVFNDGLDVKTTVDLDPDFKMEEVIQTESETPNILLRNVERIARSIHQNYKEKEESKDHVIKDYDDLDAKEKLSNVRQAKSYSYKLNLIGCEIVDKSDERKEHILLEFDREMKKDKNEYIKFLKSEINHEGDGSNEGSGPNRDEYDDEVELLAIIEHEEWCEEKRNTGWISHKEAFQQDLITKEEYDILNQANEEGFDNPDDNKLKDDERGIHVHANMVSWDELNSESQEKDRDPIRNMREILDDVGLKIVFTRLRLLTFKMHESYKEKYESKTNQIPPFEKLPKQTKYNNYKQTNLILKYLAELKYELVPIDGEGAAVEKLKRKEIEYLAEREHNAWYLTKLNQGFKYGSRREGMRNPKVKPWVELSVKDKSSNKFTFEKLPENCKKVGLKIVRM